MRGFLTLNYWSLKGWVSVVVNAVNEKSYFTTSSPITCGSCRRAVGFWHGVCVEHLKVIYSKHPACVYYAAVLVSKK